MRSNNIDELARSERVLPFVSILIPTYNAGRYLEHCLQSIKKQHYPVNKMEVLVIDGGSNDETIPIAQKYGAKIFKNPYRDAESGKSIGIQKSKGDIIALIDSDNELVENDWIKKMVKPLIDDKNIFGVESLWYIKKEDPLINQYVTLMKIADPLARRFHPVTKIIDKGDYYVNYVHEGQTPVIGANGFLWRKKLIKTINSYKPKFEEVNYISLMVTHGYYAYASAKNAGIYHYYCRSLMDYIQKRIKIGRKFLARKSAGQQTWVDQNSTLFFFLAVVYNVSFIGPLLETFHQYRVTGNKAWFWHPIISYITIIVYFVVYIQFTICNGVRRLYENK